MKHALIILVLIIIGFLAQSSRSIIDLTEDKIYTLSAGTTNLLDYQDQRILAEILFTGDLPASYKRLEIAALDLLKRFKSRASEMRIRNIDPSEGDEEVVAARMEQFRQVGLMPVPISYPGAKEFRAINAFPYVVFTSGGNRVIVSLLNQTQVGNYSDEAINEAINKLEYLFADAIYKLSQTERKKIAFIDGHGGIDRSQTIGLEKELSKYYHIGRFSFDTIPLINPEIEVIIVPGLRESLSPNALFAIDHYVMNGGRIIWMLDRYAVETDSIGINGSFIPNDLPWNVDNLLFNYGARINYDLIADRQCSEIPLRVSQSNGTANYELFPWYYEPVIVDYPDHPITQSLGKLNLQYPSTIDTVKTDGKVSKTILIQSSDYSKAQEMPRELSFDVLREPLQENYFTDQNLTISVLLEGEFSSYFRNRLSKDLQDLLRLYQLPFIEVSKPTAQVIISDVRFIETTFAAGTRPTQYPVGYNRFENQVYEGNLEFIINTIEYMTGGGFLLPAKAKKTKIRLLDEIKVTQQKFKWQSINVLLPLLLISIFGLVYNYFRGKKYAV